MRKKKYFKDENQLGLFAGVSTDTDKPHQHIEEQAVRKREFKDSRSESNLKKRAMEYRREQCGVNGSCVHRFESCASDDQTEVYIDRYIKKKWTCPEFNHECAPRRHNTI